MQRRDKELSPFSTDREAPHKKLLQAFDGLKAVVFHPEDADGATLLRELRRVGCVARNVWPPPPRLPSEIDVLICLLDDGVRELLLSRGDEPICPVVGVLDEHGTQHLTAIRDCSPLSVLYKPIAPDQVISSVYVARQIHQYESRLLRRIAKLDETLRSIRNVERAKTILMKSRHLDEHEAYHLMRRQAMEKRVPIGIIASTIIDASQILG